MSDPRVANFDEAFTTTDSRPNSQFLESFEKLDLSAKGRLELVEGELFSSRPNSQFIENFGSELNEDELSFETVTKSERSYLRHIEDETIDIVTKSDKASESESLRESLRCVEDEVAGTVTKTETKSFSHVEDETEGTVTKSDTASERVSLSHVEDETVGTIIASVRESLRYVEDETTSTVTTIKTTTSTLIDDVKTTSYKKKVMDKREKAILRTLAKIDRSMEVDLCYVLDCTGLYFLN
ncbi:25982_t:CDS:1 [Dentiscutata erythropus]|uniref:25982_t:CDS:1 n=1 Tax=Dentiscutata erythropus TaxID=1348616 RepID=A0A9N9CGY5_9GLOM|nr:25982_t:CDS:1 [Dentiscutata erythropus]